MANRLDFTVWLNDRTQKGFKSIQKNMNGLKSIAQTTNQAWTNVGMGVGGIWASGKMLDGLTRPAREMDAARGELMSLLDSGGIETANIVQNQAMDFSERYGKSAADFVKASYDIQSAIDGLSANNLATFTNASAILATATKADTVTITSYMGTMYGIFKKNANAMGKDNWVKQISGQTATAVQMFKTTGSAMNEAFANVGANATNLGIGAGEQFAILGTLQSTLGGGRAGTAYAAFLESIPKAQKTLGVNLTGEDGKALGIIETIDRLKSKLGENLGVEQKGMLSSAFGSQGAKALGLLWDKTDALKANIKSLNSVNGMEKAMKMAKDIADPYEQLEQVMNNVRVVFGQALSGEIQPFISYMISGAQTLRRWITLFPNLTKLVGYGVIGIAALTAIMSTMAVVTGIATLATTGFKASMTATKFVAKSLWNTLTFLPKLLWSLTVALYRSSAGTWLCNAAWTALNVVWKLTKLLMSGLAGGVLGLGRMLLSLVPAVWSVGAAFIATIGWIPLLIIGVIAAVAALWAYWDDFSSWFTNIWESIIGWFNKAWQDAVGWLSDTMGKVKGWFGDDEVNVTSQQEQINEHLPTVNQTTDITQAQPVAGDYITNAMKSVATTNSQSIGQVSIYPKQFADPNAISNMFMRFSS
ncbi:phage tail tape measure protein [Vibrio parahaemolyticus]|nr:phage tail tape measure protein [Vibrio parahaemolyticus]